MGRLTYFVYNMQAQSLKPLTLYTMSTSVYPLYTHNGQIRVAQLAIWHHIASKHSKNTNAEWYLMQDGVGLSPIWYVTSNGCETHRSLYGCCRPPPCCRSSASFSSLPCFVLPHAALLTPCSPVSFFPQLTPHAILLAAWFPVSFFL